VVLVRSSVADAAWADGRCCCCVLLVGRTNRDDGRHREKHVIG